jgi:hypothetical protein
VGQNISSSRGTIRAAVRAAEIFWRRTAFRSGAGIESFFAVQTSFIALKNEPMVIFPNEPSACEPMESTGCSQDVHNLFLHYTRF